MSRGRNFIDRDVFDGIMARVTRKRDGEAFEDVDTVYGDMSRLVVGWLARTPPAELRRLYHEFGWKGNANARGIHEAARAWYAEHHPDRAPRG
jgi:hypothetical protein